MRAKLKPLHEQTIVITGATSGFGLATARAAGAAGANVVLVARNERALVEIRDGMCAAGASIAYVVADVGVESDVQRVADVAIERFGGFDTWINNAGVGIYAEALNTPIEDHRKLFDTNYWGTVYGSLAAARHLKDKPGGGAIINVGSVSSDMGGPLLSSYHASKHAIKGFTDSMRIELMAAKSPVSVTLIKPGSINTPVPQRGRNLAGFKPKLPPPVYDPVVAASAILSAAQHPRRSITVGGGGKLQVLLATVLPSLFDAVASRAGGLLLDKARAAPMREGNLYAPFEDGKVEGPQRGRSFSIYTASQTHPAVTFAALAVAGGVAALWLRGRQRESRRSAAGVAVGPTAATCLNSRC